MIRTYLSVLLCTASLTFAQTPPGGSGPDSPLPSVSSQPAPPQEPPSPSVSSPEPAPQQEPPSPSLSAPPQEPPSRGRITGIETNREMIAAEAPTEIVINGSAGVHCGLAVEFGDGGSTGILVSDATPFPVRVTHTYAKTSDPLVRVAGIQTADAIPCLGAAEAAIHVSPAGSKIEYITLSTSCPEGWLLKGEVRPDKSFSCSPVADVSAPTNLIHCIDGMKYFARGGNIGCMHPALGIPEEPAKVAMVKGAKNAKGMGGKKMGMDRGMGDAMGKRPGMGMSAKAKPAAATDAGAPAGETKAKPAATARTKSVPKSVPGTEPSK